MFSPLAGLTESEFNFAGLGVPWRHRIHSPAETVDKQWAFLNEYCWVPAGVAQTSVASVVRFQAQGMKLEKNLCGTEWLQRRQSLYHTVYSDG